MTNLSVGAIVSVFCDVAEQAAVDSKATHPEDIAVAMTMAIDYAARTIEFLHNRGLLRED